MAEALAEAELASIIGAVVSQVPQHVAMANQIRSEFPCEVRYQAIPVSLHNTETAVLTAGVAEEDPKRVSRIFLTPATARYTNRWPGLARTSRLLMTFPPLDCYYFI